MADLIYHSTVRDIRKGHRNALAGLLMNILQTVIMLATFWAMFWIFGARGSAIRGDYLLYLLSGIFLYMVHTKAMGAMVRAEGSTSPMMHHAPLNTTVTMAAAAHRLALPAGPVAVGDPVRLPRRLDARW